MQYAGTNHLAILLAAAASFLFGAVWYGTLAKPWMAAVGKTEAEIKGSGQTPVLYLVAIIAQLIMAWVLAGLIGHLGPGRVTLRNGLISGAFAWLGFVVTTLAVNHGRAADSRRHYRSNGHVTRRVLCTLIDLDHTGSKGVTLGRPSDGREIVVVQTVNGVLAYVNRCPHMYSTLETFPDRFLDEDREHLVCSTHGARFRVADGLCVTGPCKGSSLEPIDVVIEGLEILLAE